MHRCQLPASLRRDITNPIYDTDNCFCHKCLREVPAFAPHAPYLCLSLTRYLVLVPSGLNSC
jgi:hypothetical protein